MALAHISIIILTNRLLSVTVVHVEPAMPWWENRLSWRGDQLIYVLELSPLGLIDSVLDPVKGFLEFLCAGIQAHLVEGQVWYP